MRPPFNRKGHCFSIVLDIIAIPVVEVNSLFDSTRCWSFVSNGLERHQRG